MNIVDVIIPTHNRTNYLKRVLDYYSDQNSDFNFIVADSSSPTIKQLNKKLVRNYSKLRILYIDKFSDKLIQSHKFAEMVKYAKSKYCVFCADDDFIVPEAIKECIIFLEKNPDYVAAHGTYIGFYLFNSLIGIKRFWWQFRHSPISISSSNPVERLSSLLTNSSQILWSVRRTAVVKDCYAQFKKIDFDPSLLPVMGELLPDSLTILKGKVKGLDTFYAARQFFGSVISYYPNLQDAINKGIYDLEYNKFKKCILKNLNKVTTSGENTASKTIDLAIEKVIKNSNQQYLTNKFYLLTKHLPIFIINILQLLNAGYLFSKPKRAKIGLLSKSSSKYFNDFKVLAQSVIKNNV